MCHVVALFSSLIWILHLFPDPLGITDKKLCVTIKELYLEHSNWSHAASGFYEPLIRQYQFFILIYEFSNTSLVSAVTGDVSEADFLIH